MKAGTDFEETCHSAADMNPASSRLGNAANDFQEGRLAGTIASDDTDHFTGANPEVNVLQGPEFGGFVAVLSARPKQRKRRTQRILHGMTEPIPARAKADHIFLGEVFNLNGNIIHPQISILIRAFV